MEGTHILRDLLRAGDWITKVDLKDAYFIVPIHEEDRGFLKLSFKERTYQFKCLPFGLTCAPWVFTKTLKPIAAQLRQLGMRLIVKKIRAETQCLLEAGQVTGRKLSQLLGRLQAATRAIPLGPLFYCKLQQALQRGLEQSEQDYSAQDHCDRQTLISDRIRCLNSRLGNILRRGTDWWPLVLRGETVAYQLPGSIGSLASIQ